VPVSIDKPSKYFNTVLYTGNGSNNYSVTGNDFSADFIWIKCRSASLTNHHLTDIVRGFGTGSTNTPTLNSDATSAEYQRNIFSSTGVTSTGFSLNNYSDTNTNGATYSAWCWEANGTGVSNTAGSISSTVSANTTSGFSIVSYTGNGSNSTVGHGLGVAPKFIIFKNRSSTTGWACYNKNIGASKYLALNETIEAQTATGVSNSTDPTSSVFSIGTADRVNTNGNNYIAYCFAEVKGFSKFSSFVGNGSTDGAFVYTGFKPAFVMIKASSVGGTGYNWGVWDNKRLGYNADNNDLRINLTNAEATDDSIDLLSNGFKIRTDSGGFGGGSGTTYIYMCFAESPFVSSKSIPTTAR
jgi:hypothetical protein